MVIYGMTQTLMWYLLIVVMTQRISILHSLEISNYLTGFNEIIFFIEFLEDTYMMHVKMTVLDSICCGMLKLQFLEFKSHSLSARPSILLEILKDMYACMYVRSCIMR